MLEMRTVRRLRAGERHGPSASLRKVGREGYGGLNRICPGRGRFSGARRLRRDSARRRATFRADPKVRARLRIRLPCRMSWLIM